MTDARRQAALAPVLIFTTMVSAVISSLGAPLIPSISDDLHVSLSTAQWSLTATLLVGAVSAPIMGRLGDGRRRRETLIGGLALVTLGGALAALAPNLTLLVVGRGLQGIGLGLIPLTMAAARDHLPRERVPATIALLSVCAAAGVGAGYPISGLIADGLGLSAAFWFGAAVSGSALLCVILVVPSSRDRAKATLDIPGALLLTAGLVALLLAIAEGNVWGWGSPAIVGLLVAAAIVLTTWVFQQLRTRAPLVELRLLRHPAVLTGNGCAIVLGLAMYMYLSGVTEFVQTPSANGFGFSASVVQAGLCLVPLSILSLAASRALPWVTRLVGPRALLPVGSLATALAGAFFALFHSVAVAGLRDDGHPRHRPRPDLRGDPRPDRARRARARDGQRDGLLPGRPLRQLLAGQRAERVDPLEPHPGRRAPADRERLHARVLDRGRHLPRRRRPHLDAAGTSRVAADPARGAARRGGRRAGDRRARRADAGLDD